MKWYSIICVTGGGLFQEDNVVQAKNSREAIEKVFKKPMKYLKSDSEVNSASKVWSVIEGDRTGRVYRDYRKRKFYTLK